MVATFGLETETLRVVAQVEYASSTSELDDEQLARFKRDGFLILPGFLPGDLVARIKPEVDRWVDDGLRADAIAAAVDPVANAVPPVLEVDLPAHGELIAYPPLLRAISQVIGSRFAFHHMHSDRHAPDLPGKPWHHDYEQRVQTDRAYGMVHALHYLDGIDPDMAGLAVLPGSHREVAEKTARAHLGTDLLPGELFIDFLPPGSTVLVHSALFHARRAKPGYPGRPRYFVDSSYCEVGTLWPPVKPYWREILARARRNGLAGADWPDLFAERHFSEFTKPRRR